MSDFSRLELAVDSNNAVKNLKNVETHLNKTADAANSLKNTLKNIGLGIGLTALLKQSIELENSTKALDKRFKTFFGRSGSNEVKVLTDNFSLANRQAKELLTTAAKFGSATGMNGEGLTNFSSQLSQLAADVAAFHAIDDIDQVMERFGSATLGRTQGLREFGVQIDKNSESFKNQVAAIQANTGATEAQATAMAVLKNAQEQLAYTQGSAGEQSTSAWQQLTNLFKNFKDLLANIGTILGAVFGPFLSVLNKILNLPVVRWIVAISVVLGLVLGTVNKLNAAQNALYSKISAEQSAGVNSQDKLLSLQEKFNQAKTIEKELQEKITRLKKEQVLAQQYLNERTKSGQYGKASANYENYFSERRMKYNQPYSIPSNSELAGQINSNMQRINEAQQKIAGNMDFVIGKFNLLTRSALMAIPGFEKLDKAFQAFLLTNALTADSIKKVTIATMLKNGAEALQNGLKKIDIFLTGIWTAVIGANTAAKNENTAATVVNTLAYKAAGKALLNSLGLFAKIIGKIAIIAGIVLIAIDAIQILFQGITKGFDNINAEELISNKILLPMWKWIEQKAFNWTSGLIGFDWDGVEKGAEKAKEALQKVKDLIKSVEDFKKNYERFIWSAYDLSNKLKLLPQYTKKIAELRKFIEDRTKYLAEMESGKAGVDKSDAVKYQQEREKLYRERDEAIKELQRLQGFVDEFSKLKDKLNNARRDLQSAVNDFYIETSIFYDKKTGSIIDDKNAAALMIANREIKTFTKEFEAAIKGNKSIEEVQRILERLKTAYKTSYSLRMDALQKEKDRLIENQKAMNSLIQTSIGFQKTSTQGVYANSMQAVELQTREKTGPNADAMKKVATQSEEIKRLNKQQVDLAHSSYDSFVKFIQKFDNYVGKTAGATGNKQLIVVNYN